MTARVHDASASSSTAPSARSRPSGSAWPTASSTTQAIELTMLQAATHLDEGRDDPLEVATAKFWAADGGNRIAHAALHIHGGISIDVDFPIHRYFLWLKQLRVHARLGHAGAPCNRQGARRRTCHLTNCARGLEELLERVEVEGRAGHHDEVLGARVEISLPVVDLAGVDRDRALDLARVAVETRAPVVEHAVLRREVLGRPERVPRVGVLGDERSVTFSPDPPTRIGSRPCGGGSSRPNRSMIIGSDRARSRRRLGRRCRTRSRTPCSRVRTSPAPTPRMKRPSLTWSIVRAMSASRFGLRYELQVTSAPSAACSVSAAIAASNAYASKCAACGIAVQREEVVPDPDAVDLERVGGVPRGPQIVDGGGLRMQLHADLEPAMRPHFRLRRSGRAARCGVRRRAGTSVASPAKQPAAAVHRRGRRASRSPSRLGSPCKQLRQIGARREHGGVEIELRRPLREPRADHRDSGRERPVDVIGFR